MIAFGLGGFAAGSALRQLALATRRQGWRGMVGRANGGMVVHLGTIMIAVAFAASSSFIRQAEFTLKPNQSARIDGHTVEYLGQRTVEQENRVESIARVRVDGDRVFEPRLNKYRLTGQTIGTPSVRVGPGDDVYLAMTSAPGGPKDPPWAFGSSSSRSWCGCGSAAWSWSAARRCRCSPGPAAIRCRPASAPVPVGRPEPEPEPGAAGDPDGMDGDPDALGGSEPEPARVPS